MHRLSREDIEITQGLKIKIFSGLNLFFAKKVL